jgi:hypothetical protein
MLLVYVHSTYYLTRLSPFLVILTIYLYPSNIMYNLSLLLSLDINRIKYLVDEVEDLIKPFFMFSSKYFLRMISSLFNRE